MNTEQKIEGNKLIAEFMGVTVYEDLWEVVSKHESIKHQYVISDKKLITRPYKPDRFFEEPETICYCKKDNKGTKIRTEYWYENEYHTSWDWLMPCIKKIKDWVLVNNMGVSLYQPINQELQLLDIKTTHEAVVKFITWYTQKQNQ